MATMNRRFQFSLRGLFVAMLVAAAFFGGMSVQKQLDKPVSHRKVTWGGDDKIIGQSETMVLRDGTVWHRGFDKPIAEKITRTSVERERRSRRSDPSSPLFTKLRVQK